MEYCNIQKMYDALKNNGVLVTYAARGVVKKYD
jgi:tRNA U34 5-methylaminomethyl-2-thiouridine-forming methyltransferase MnmC